ncbi:MAG: hypothetical protein QXI19_06840 [Candidatus Caldarchaeum sp.]
MRVGWYLLLYGGFLGLVGLAGVSLEISHLMGMGILDRSPLHWVLRATLPLLAAPIGWLLLRRSDWLPLASSLYLGYAIPTLLGCVYLEWQFVRGIREILGEKATFALIFEETMSVFWYAYLILLCQFCGVPEMLNRRWRVGIGFYLLLWWAFPLLSAGLRLYEQWPPDPTQPYRISSFLADLFQGLGAGVWILLGWTLLRNKGWLPAIGLALIALVTLAVAQRMVWLATLMTTGTAGAVWHSLSGTDIARLVGMLALATYNSLLLVAPLVLLLAFLLPAFPTRLMHYLRLWRLFRQRKLQAVR